MGGLRGTAAGVAMCAAMVWSSAALAQTSLTRSSSFAYQPGSGLLTQEVIEPNTSALRLQTDYTLNAFGHKTQVTVSGVDIATRSATTTYDAKGQFPTSATNALGHSESWQHDARFGAPTSHTGPNALTTTWTYDGFGRKTLEVRADGTRTTWSYKYCAGTAGGTASCPTRGSYLVETKALGADGTTQIAPTATAYFDQLDREIAKDTEGFDGSLIRTSTEYDALGRVAKKSRPYFVSGGTPKWITYTYDTLGRVLTQTDPDNGVVTNAYNGLTTSVTNALNQTTTSTKNSQGQVVAVKDADNNTSAFQYDPFGNLTKVTDAAGNITTYAYDTRGRKIAANDPDLGASTYTYDVLDKLITHTNAAAEVTTYTYDLLGRVSQRVEPGLTSTWVWDTASKGLGKLAAASTSGGYNRTHTYDALGRPDQVGLTMGGNTYSIISAYDSASRISSVTYPSGFAVSYSYNATGYQSQLANAVTSQVLWTANARDAELHLTQFTAGNGVVTNQAFDPNSGRLTSTMAGNGAVQNQAYTYDLLDRLVTRSDANTSLSETFTYDNLSRLTSSTVSLNPTPLVATFSYNAIGNLISKTDVGTYSYPAPGDPRPHGVVSISGGVINTTFSYDAKGNMTSGNGLTVTYAPFNKPTTISRGTASVAFDHDPEHQRYSQLSANGLTYYIAGAGVLAERFAGAGGIIQWTNYLFAAGQMIGVYIEKSDETVATRFFHLDHLGSVSVITDENGVVVERLSYDAWGLRRHPDGTSDPAGAITSQATRGFTGHEHLAEVGLIHMNGRVYDPLLGRFGTPDPMTENPFSTQGWNRYSYVGNSPLNFTDPSGYCFLGCFWKPLFKAVAKFFKQALGGILSYVASALICGPAAPVCAAAVAAATSTFIVGVTSGDLGQALRAGLITLVTAGAMHAVADIVGSAGGGFGGNTFASASGSDSWGPMMRLCPAGGCNQLPLMEVTTPSASTVVQGTVTAGSFLPGPVGSAFSLAEAGGYAWNSDWVNAGISATAAGLGVFSNAGVAKAGLTAAAATKGSTSLAERAMQIHDALDPIARARRTTAVLQTDAGRIVAGGARDLTPAQRYLLGSGEIAAQAPGVHAELTALQEAARIGAAPLEMAVTRPICPPCAAALEASGARLTSPTTVVWPQR